VRLYLIWSIEHGMWWRPGRCGYTLSLAEAGRYSFVEATEILARANFVRVNECTIPAECVRLFAPLTTGEREQLHELLEEAVAVIDPEQHAALVEGIDAVLTRCDEAGVCVPFDVKPSAIGGSLSGIPEQPACEHGTALDVHCCNCHSGFLFDVDACVCSWEEKGRDGMFQLSDFNLTVHDKPRGDTIFVLPLVHAVRSAHGLITTEARREQPVMGVVLAVGPGSVSVETGRPIPVLSQPGEFVKIPHFAGLDDEAEHETGAVPTVLLRDHEVLAYRDVGTFELEVHEGDPRKAHLKGYTCEHCPVTPVDLTRLQALGYGEPGDVIDAEVKELEEQPPAPAAGPSALIEQERERLRQERAQREAGELPAAGRVVAEEHDGTIVPVDASER
jgi:co-chaperonin GroES (HSP10)